MEGEGGSEGAAETASTEASAEVAETESAETASSETEQDPEQTEGAGEAASPEATSEGDDDPEPWKFLRGKAKVVGKELDRAAKESIGKEYAQLKSAASDLSKENKALKAQLEEAKRTARTPGPEATEEAEVPPELSDVETHLKAVEDERKALPGRLQRAAQSLYEKHEALAEAKYELKRADEIDKSAAETKLLRAEMAHEKALSAWEALDARQHSIAKDIQKANAQVDTVKRQIESEKQDKNRSDQARTTFMEEFPAHFDQEAIGAADRLKFPAGDDLRKVALQLLGHAGIADYYSLRDVPPDQVDLPKLLEHHVKDLIRFGDLYSKAKLNAISKNKAAGVSTVTPRPNPAANPAPGAQPASDDWRTDPKIVAARNRVIKRGELGGGIR